MCAATPCLNVITKNYNEETLTKMSSAFLSEKWKERYYLQASFYSRQE